MEEGQQIAIHCRGCLAVTKHEARKVHRESWSEIHSQICLDHQLTVSLLLCAGCRTASVRVAEGCQQLSDDWLVSFVAPQPTRPMPEWIARFPSQAQHIASLLREVHAALTSQQLWLVAMGCRTLIDMFALARVGDVGGFKAKLERLVKEDYLTSRDRIVIEDVVEIGHDATHRAQPPSIDDCHLCLNIVENLLHRLALDDDASRLQERKAKGRHGKLAS